MLFELHCVAVKIAEKLKIAEVMNASEPRPGVPPEYVMATKWVVEGLLLPAVGSVGIVGNLFISQALSNLEVFGKTDFRMETFS